MVMRIGWDPGFGSNNAVVCADGAAYMISMPSVVGVGRLEASGLSLAGLDSARREAYPDQVVFSDGETYLVGENVARYTRPIERVDFARFTEGADLRALLYALLARLEVAGEQAALAIGLPVELLSSKARGQAVEKGLAAWLVGEHRFELNGSELRFEIVKIRATVAQPLGAWLDWGMDTAGQWVRGPEGRKAPALVIDQGFNTLDLFGIEEGKPSARFTAGDTLGMRRVAETIGQNIRRRYGVEVNLVEADRLLRSALDGSRGAALIYSHGEPVDVSGEVRQALSSAAAEVLAFIDRVVGREANRFRLILTGGGALALSDRLLREYPHAEMAPQPVLANARGLGKLAASGYLGA